MRPEFEQKEWGVVGEFVAGNPGPVAPAPPPFVIPPPPWSPNYDPALDPDHEPPVKAEAPDEEDER